METKLPDWIAYKDEHDEVVYRFCIITHKDNAAITFIVARDSPAITLPWHRVLKVKQGGEE